MESNQTLVPEKEEKNQLNSDDNRAEQDGEEEAQQRGECGDHENAESQTSSSLNGKEILKAIEVVERDSMAIAHSYTSLFASLRSTLSEISGGRNVRFREPTIYNEAEWILKIDIAYLQFVWDLSVVVVVA
ncbi:hypothetical protein KY290_034834 [Solanum tuberosum]|uniref:Uncharacterized protein n=1 Tax=Solanum tuberosum TaxID=4113 RepID=A0ABQ7U4C3_SOLTU|nr:hypothetical protein KY289_034210 [Solanum tuberosum]KAH0646023.1 hypothetical protein KY284_033907 [Solanum tuberosum]KAH0741791.1 hypothetical protein KY290_034834 [Solanum tuberosum]